MGQVVEDEDEVGLDEGGRRDADRVAIGQRDGRLEGRDRVVGERADGAAGEARHALGRLRRGGAARSARMRGQRVGEPERRRPAGPARRPATVTGRVWVRATPSRTSSSRRGPTPEERVAAEPLAALDGLEEVRRARRRRAGGTRRSGVSRSAGRVARRRSVSALAARRFAWARLSGSVVGASSRAGLGESRTTFRPRDERSCLPRCHPHSAMPHSRDRRVAGVTRRRSALPAIAGALRRSLLACGVCRRPFGPEAPGSIPRRRRPGFHQPPGLCADVRRVLVPFTARSS